MSNALEGMHPTLRHVPPSDPRISTHAVFRPSCPALMAATYPPGPPPITTRSYCSIDVGVWEKWRRDDADAAAALPLAPEAEAR